MTETLIVVLSIIGVLLASGCILIVLTVLLSAFFMEEHRTYEADHIAKEPTKHKSTDEVRRRKDAA